MAEPIVVKVATCNLNQWAMDFDLNKANVIESIRLARKAGAHYRTGPELELCGYSCEDHYFEQDTEAHCWESLADILVHPDTQDILYDVGMPVAFNNVRYNTRVWCYSGRILGIRPKLIMANNGNYRETRWFTPWTKGRLAQLAGTVDMTASAPNSGTVDSASYLGGADLRDLPSLPADMEWFKLPAFVRRATSFAPHHAPGLYPGAITDPSLPAPQCVRPPQLWCPLGVFLVRTAGATFASEVCEELYTPAPAHTHLYLAGADIISNSSGSHHNLRKLDLRLSLLRSASKRGGGVYLYANQKGCDGARLYYDGCACICDSGRVLAQGHQFSLNDVECVTAVVDVQRNRSTRATIPSSSVQAAAQSIVSTIYATHVPGAATHAELLQDSSVHGCRWPSLLLPHRDPPPGPRLSLTAEISPRVLRPEEEIGYGPACWLWDYLRRSGVSGYFLPLSGGADSASTAAIVGVMCQVVARAYAQGNESVIADVDRLLHRKPGMPAPTARELCGAIFFTVYMGTVNSSKETEERAAQLARELGCWHASQAIDGVVAASVQWLVDLTGFRPRFQGSTLENLALQNVQARVRMVQSYLAAQMLLTAQGRHGSLLVLGSANVDEALRGFLTKYDCSSADINPIGGICKLDLRQFLRWAGRALGYPTLTAIADAKATPELVPRSVDSEGNVKAQVSEEDMGMTFEELGALGRLRKVCAQGPVAMFRALVEMWGAPGERGCKDEDAEPLPSREGEDDPNTEKNLCDRGEQGQMLEHTLPAGERERRSPTSIATLLKRFMTYYSINRHKTTVLTPAYHAENYSPDDNRFDLRQFLYNIRWPRQFRQIDALAKEMEEKQ